jgi:cytidylate kinase
MVVAIDGPAGAGKSTVAKRLAERMGFFYLNSGNFYRAVTFAVLEHGDDPENEQTIIQRAESCDLEIREGNLYLNGINIENHLHSDAVDQWVAQHSAIIKVRKVVNKLIRKATAKLDVVAEGRDMTTVVFPSAEVKIYLDASMTTRTKRRFDQGTSALTPEKIAENLEKRDYIDKTKPFGNLKIASDSLYLDSTDLTIEEVCERVQEKILEAKKKSRS